MPADLLKELPGYDPDVQKNRAQARHIMEQLGYGPANRLKIKVSTRDLPPYRDPAVILIDQLKEVYFDGELETSTPPSIIPRSGARTMPSLSTFRKAGPIPTRSSMRFTAAVRART